MNNINKQFYFNIHKKIKSEIVTKNIVIKNIFHFLKNIEFFGKCLILNCLIFQDSTEKLRFSRQK